MLVKNAMVKTPLQVKPEAKLREILDAILGGDQDLPQLGLQIGRAHV